MTSKPEPVCLGETKMPKRIRRRKVCPDRIRSRLFEIVLTGEDRDAVNAARVLLSQDRGQVAGGPDEDLLAEFDGRAEGRDDL